MIKNYAMIFLTVYLHVSSHRVPALIPEPIVEEIRISVPYVTDINTYFLKIIKLLKCPSECQTFLPLS